tara:strand:- start:1422 stop:1694 length:273 start_codon:yes stop_codon:yes gene_type:complete
MRRRKNGTLGSLFINKTAEIPTGQWLQAETHSTKGYADRQGWHCLLEKKAPHLKEEGREWVEVSVTQFKFFVRPESQGGVWVLAQRMKIL